MSSIFSFMRNREDSPGDELPAESASAPAEPTAAGVPMTAPTRTELASVRALDSAFTPGDALSEMLAFLRQYLEGLPTPSISVTSVTERSLSLGNWRGMERRGSFDVVGLKGGRLDAGVRFQFLADTPNEVEEAVEVLRGRLLAARDELWIAHFLQVVAQETSLAEHVSALNSWRITADYQVLYEYHYQDSDGADSLIAQIPISIDSTHNESTTVTDEMTRWDNESAPMLVVRGRLTVGRLSALVLLPGAPPTGPVTLRRTFDGALDPPTSYSTLGDFLAAVAGPTAADRHGQVIFAALSDFLAAFEIAGTPVVLGDWDEDGLADSYEPGQLLLDPAIQLPTVGDRLELSYHDESLDQVAVIYLQARPR